MFCFLQDEWQTNDVATIIFRFITFLHIYVLFPEECWTNYSKTTI